MKVYELIQQLAKLPPDMVLGVAVIGENVCMLNNNDDGTVDIDSFRKEPEINVISSKSESNKEAWLEVIL